MSTNKVLYELCQKIWYEDIKYDKEEDVLYEVTGITRSEIPGEILEEITNCRTLIFTPLFKELFEEYYYWKNNWVLYKFDDILEHLDDPVKYLYSLLNNN